MRTIRLDRIAGVVCEENEWGCWTEGSLDQLGGPTYWTTYADIDGRRMTLADRHTEDYGRRLVAALTQALADPTILLVDPGALAPMIDGDVLDTRIPSKTAPLGA
jgi:hypothetical protein